MTLVSAGRVGRAHGRDGSFHVDGADHALSEGTALVVRGERRRVERRAGTDARPLVRLSGIDDREAAAALRGEPLLVEDQLKAGEWLAADLVGLRAGSLGTVVRVLDAPSCDLLELDDGTLIPFVSDAIRVVDVEAGVIDVDEEFLG